MAAKKLTPKALAPLVRRPEPMRAGDRGVDERSIRNWSRKGSPTPPSEDNLYKLCTALDLNPADFERAAEEYEAQQRMTPEQEPDAPRWWKPLWSLVAVAILMIIAAVAIFVVVRHRRLETFKIAPALTDLYDNAYFGDVSPDGTQILFSARSTRTKKRTLYLYSLADRTTLAVPKSEGNYTSFFWHADSRSVYYITDVDLVKVTAGVPERVADGAEALKGAVNRDGTVILGSRKGLMRVGDTGHLELLTKTEPTEISHTLPLFLPDQQNILFTITKRHSTDRMLAVVSLAGGPMRKLFPIPTTVQYFDGHLFYVRNRTLVARAFDLERLQFTGVEKVIAAPVWSRAGTGEIGFSVSERAIVIRPFDQVPPIYHRTADGGTQAVIDQVAEIEHIRAGRVTDRIALVGRSHPRDDVSLWLFSLTDRQRTQIGSAGIEPSSPVFSRDDRFLYYAAAGRGYASIYAIDLDKRNSAPAVIIDPEDKHIVAPRDISPDGRFLLFHHYAIREGNLWLRALDYPHPIEPFIATPEDEGESARFSPDGRKVVFVGKRNDQFSVYVADFPATGDPPISAIEGHGWRARWNEDGTRIYFIRGNGVYEANPRTRETHLLFSVKDEIWLFEPARDGGFFVREISVPQSSTVVTHWWPGLVKQPLDLAVSQ